MTHLAQGGYSSQARMKDEVYRHMFRLEEQRPDAEIDLACALLRAIVAADMSPKHSEQRQWLKNICPICLELMEGARRMRA